MLQAPEGPFSFNDKIMKMQYCVKGIERERELREIGDRKKYFIQSKHFAVKQCSQPRLVRN